MVFEHQGEHESQWAAIESISAKIGCTAETLRKWVRRAERDRGLRAGVSSDGYSRPGLFHGTTDADRRGGSHQKPLRSPLSSCTRTWHTLSDIAGGDSEVLAWSQDLPFQLPTIGGPRLDPAVVAIFAAEVGALPIALSQIQIVEQPVVGEVDLRTMREWKTV